jgi:hypothetical protein
MALWEALGLLVVQCPATRALDLKGIATAYAAKQAAAAAATYVKHSAKKPYFL